MNEYMTNEENDEIIAVILANSVYSEDNINDKKEVWFDKTKALAVLFAHDVIFINSFWWEEKWPKEAQDCISINVICNDIFYWGASDAERLNYDEVENLYRFWEADNNWGPSIWCMLQRNQMPQDAVKRIIKEIGKWDLKKLQLGEKEPNKEEIKQYLNTILRSEANFSE